MLSLHLKNPNELTMYCDEEGLATLIKAIEKLRPSGGHTHFRSAGAGGKELAEVTPWGDKAIDELVIEWTGE